VSHAFVTVIAAIPAGRIAAARALIESAPVTEPLTAALADMQTIHFASLNVFEASDGIHGHLVFEFSGDGAADDLLEKIDQRVSPALDPVFALAVDRGSQPLLAYWKSHVVAASQSWFGNPGVNFTGTPGFSVRRIHRERDLAAHITDSLPPPQPDISALSRLEAVRRLLRKQPEWEWALEAEPIAQGGTLATLPLNFGAILPYAGRLAPPFARTFLWPLAIPPVLAFILVLWLHGLSCASAWLAACWALTVAIVTVALAGLGALAAYILFRRREDRELPIDRPPAPGTVAAIMDRENHAAQNLLAAVSVMKPGRLRRFTVTFAFWLIAQFVGRFYRAGFLGSIGSIHFARWIMVPRTGDLLFLSNYGGSWESYLEDFITKAHTGLTGVWSNTVGFPKASNLFLEGATDGDRFKRWARRQQVPTAFWFSAYRDLTTTNIRTNAAIRQGLAVTMTEDEAQSWLSLFGSERQPATALESSEIQSLILGGLGFLRYGAAVLFRLGDDVSKAKAWLREALPSVSFSDGRSLRDATILGLTATALPRLGLPNDSVETFPPAFLDGMAAPWRLRALGDVGKNAPTSWWWGDPDRGRIDGVLVLYAREETLFNDLVSSSIDSLRQHGHVAVQTIPFRDLPDKGSLVPTGSADGKDTADRENADVKLLHAKCEPFGFVDGISQPVIRGTYKALRGADPIHLVEAGEFILGYPDNRGFMPPGPTLAAIHDPDNRLPITAGRSLHFNSNVVNADRDLGRNGSYLVIRHLEQDVHGFWEACSREGDRLASSFPAGVTVKPKEFIAAKMVGRWQDGSPLVRYPRYPATDAPVPQHGPMSRAGAGGAAMQIAPPSAQGAATLVAQRADARTGDAAPSDPGAAQIKWTLAFEPDNDFLFGSEDPQALRCPFGAHIRRANPRESFEPGSLEQLAITNRHRIMRVGRFYRPTEGQKEGIFFMCLNGDLERQFEFVQQTWLQSPTFHGLANERDPLFAEPGGHGGFTIPSRAGPLRVGGLQRFVQTRGGGYFFLPGRRFLTYLAT
jgi:deferrochelatase/peroxidase EfeB